MPFARQKYDAVVIGSGPNGMAAAITIASTGRAVVVVEGQETIGGGTRSAELTAPGFVHDVCSAVHPMAVASPFFRGLPLRAHGLDWVEPELPLAHPLDDGSAVALDHSVSETAKGLGEDGNRYTKLMDALVADWPRIESFALGPLRFPHHPFAAARFGFVAMRSATGLANKYFRGVRARALLAGLAAHSVLPLERVPSAAVALVLGIAAHRGGWPVARGGSQCIADALAAHLRSLGGEVVTGHTVESLGDLPAAPVVLCDVTPRQLARMGRSRLPAGFVAKLERYRYGPGVCKIDWALDAAIPWRAGACRRAGTVHVGGTFEEIAASERAAWNGTLTDTPFVLLAQPTVCDATRAPRGRHTAWAYCLVPNGSRADMTAQIEAQVERFAPGFRNRILQRRVVVAADMERHNPNLIGGDIGGGAMNLGQLFLRPTRKLYRTPTKGIYICSSSTPPGGGVHGMCGHLAARATLRDLGV
jgi:phytoene dehydrogenase-like protein